MNSPVGSDVFNFGFRDNSLDDLPIDDFPSGNDFGLARKQGNQKKGSIINFSVFSGQDLSSGQNNKTSNDSPGFQNNMDDKPRLLPSRFLSKVSANNSPKTSPRQNDSPRQFESPKKDPFELPPLSTLFGFSDNSQNQSESPPPMDEAHRFQPKQTSNFLNFNNQRMTPQEDFSEKTSVSISDSSDAKPIPNFNQNSPIKKKQQVKINSHKKKSKNLNENDQDAQNYNYNDQQQQSPQQVYQPPPPEIHMDIENAFDMAIDNFYHYFFNELKSILKPSPLPITSPELDNFAYSMIDEIERSLQLPQSSVSQIAISKTNETIDLILKEETSQMAQYLKQKSLRLKAQEERDMVDLQKLGNEVSDLDSQYRKLSIHVLKNLERERIELVKNNETEKERQKALLDSKRNLDLKLLELKAVANRQNNEVLKLQRDENSIYSMREELRENLLDSYDVKYKKLRSKIMNEIRSIADYIDDPIFESISSAAEEIKYKLRFSDNNNDLQQPMFNFQPIFMQYPKQKMLPKQREANENDHGKECINSIANIAMKKLEELRKQREKAFKGVKTSKKKKE